MVTRATVTSSKTVDFSFRGPLGFEARTVLLSVESESPDQMAFESTGGNMDVMGLAEFTCDPAELHRGHARVALRDQEQVVRVAGSPISFRGQVCHF